MKNLIAMKKEFKYTVYDYSGIGKCNELNNKSFSFDELIKDEIYRLTNVYVNSGSSNDMWVYTGSEPVSNYNYLVTDGSNSASYFTPVYTTTNVYTI